MANRCGVVALLGATGCPFLWGPPQWATGQADADADTDSDADADADTDTDVDPADAPTVDGWAAELAFDQVDLSITLSDPDDDLEGGTLGLFVDGALDGTYPIASLDGWDGATGAVATPLELGCASRVVTYGAIPTDAAGHVGDEATTELAISAREDDEVGNAPIPVTTTPPHVLCADHDGPSDLDAWDLTFTVAGTFSVYVVDVEGTEDHDLRLLDDEGNVILASDDSLDPDRITEAFEVGRTYHLVAIQTPGGVAGAYQVVIGAPQAGGR